MLSVTVTRKDSSEEPLLASVPLEDVALALIFSAILLTFISSFLEWENTDITDYNGQNLECDVPLERTQESIKLEPEHLDYSDKYNFPIKKVMLAILCLVGIFFIYMLRFQ